jgi:hypothetical protein
VPMDNGHEYKSTLEDFSVELENGIFNMVVSLCQHKSNFISVEDAKEEVAKFLEQLTAGLRFQEDNPLSN